MGNRESFLKSYVINHHLPGPRKYSANQETAIQSEWRRMCSGPGLCFRVDRCVLTDQNGGPKVSCNILCPVGQSAIHVNQN